MACGPVACQERMEALAALKYEDDESPAELAVKAKENGNKNFKRAAQIKKKLYFKEALKHYTEGCLHTMKARELEDTPDLRDLHATLLCNRAACNLPLKNFGSVKRDCTDALKLAPGNVKAYFRRAKVWALVPKDGRYSVNIFPWFDVLLIVC